jgi:hypothetical protein
LQRPELAPMFLRWGFARVLFTCQAAEKAVRALPVSPNPNPLGRRAQPKPDFISSGMRVSDDDIPTTHITVAVEDVSWINASLSMSTHSLICKVT